MPVVSDGRPAPDEETVAIAGRAFNLARSGGADTLADWVDHGLPVNLTNGGGDTLLVLAAYHAHPATVRALLDRGADPDRVNDRGQTALGAAVFRQSRDAVEALLAAGADPDLGRQSGRATADFFALPEMAALLPPPVGSA